MKKLLLILTILTLSFSAQSQLNCGTAIDVSASGTFIAPAYTTGTYLSMCYGSKSGISALWYKYIATANGEVTISSNLPVNDGIAYTNDTRLSIVRGPSCPVGPYRCFDNGDNISSTNLLTSVTFPVASGTTYYIQWDNFGKAVVPSTPTSLLGFQFTVSFNTVGCIRPNKNGNFLPNDITTTSQTIVYELAAGSPPTYDIDWSNSFSIPAGFGTIVNNVSGTDPTAFFLPLTSLPSESNFRYYVRSNCGGGSTSAWQGPKFGFLAKTLPYSLTFEDATKSYTDGFVGFQRYTSTATSNPTNLADSPDGFGNAVFTANSSLGTSNGRGYTRGISVTAGEVVTFQFKTKLYPSTGSPMNFDLTVGTNQINTAQTVLQSYIESNSSVYTQRTYTWTAPTTGTYFFGFHNNSPQVAPAGLANLFIDSISITSGPLSSDTFANNSFSISPNPTDKFINVSNTENIYISEINITDLNGRIVKSQNISNVSNIEINVADLTTGMYLMNINTEKGIVTKKIMKN